MSGDPDGIESVIQTYGHGLSYRLPSVDFGKRFFYTQVAKRADAPDLGSNASRHEGSNPSLCISSNVRKVEKVEKC